jgi:hypothetical protein
LEYLFIFLNFSLLIPLFIGLCRIKELDKQFSVLIIYLFVSLFNELYSLIPHSDIGLKISYSISYITESQCFLYIFYMWSINRTPKLILFQILFLILSFFDILIMLNSDLKSIELMHLIQTLFLLILSTKVLIVRRLRGESKMLLIAIPFIIHSIYFIILNLLMWFLYSQSTKSLFINLYSIIPLINFLSYISYSLAFIWAPKKEKYL